MPKAPSLGESDVDYKMNVGDKVRTKKSAKNGGKEGRITATLNGTYTVKFTDGSRESGYGTDELVSLAESKR